MHDKNKVGESCDIIAPLLFTLCVFLLDAAIPTIHNVSTYQRWAFLLEFRNSSFLCYLPSSERNQGKSNYRTSNLSD
jgi:hypothetical protein